MQARKIAGEISTLDLKTMRMDTESPKQEQSVAPQNGPWSKQNKIFKNNFFFYCPTKSHSKSGVS